MQTAEPTNIKQTASDAEPEPMSTLLSTVNLAVNSVRGAKMSGGDFRRMARDRADVERDGYEPIRVAATLRHS